MNKQTKIILSAAIAVTTIALLFVSVDKLKISTQTQTVHRFDNNHNVRRSLTSAESTPAEQNTASGDQQASQHVAENQVTTSRSLRFFDPRTIAHKEEAANIQAFNLPPGANDWCYPSSLPPLPYHDCDPRGIVNSIPLFGGLTNALKMILLGVIHSYEDHNHCFFINQTGSQLSQHHVLENYFEPIGLDVNSKVVQDAIKENRVQERTWQDIWLEHRQSHGTLVDIPYLNYIQAEGHGLKRNMLKRMWRPKANVRKTACEGLEKFGLSQEFMVFSVRRGDKTEENMSFATTEQYVERAQIAIQEQFQGAVPLIFVATDSCEVMEELRALRPAWTFVGECDKMEHQEHGFALTDVPNWTEQQAEAHYMKFFTELFAMASAKVFIGVWYTNVSWWAFFMRQNGDLSSFILLDTPGKPVGLPFVW
mmetsp:Transcript_297/g.422  ORF Transcript_297/g.422 Transcript_297/m.422 type:complete len:423 (-) Transcript_297:93-1361(-)